MMSVLILDAEYINRLFVVVVVVSLGIRLFVVEY